MSTTHTARQVEKTIRTIEARYAIGKEILKHCGAVSPHGEITKLAARHNISRDMAQKLRAMATKDIGYTKSELNQWFREFREAEFALTISHFVKLISVPKGRTRDSLTRKAIGHRWSSHRLQAEIISRQGRRQVGGRRPTVIVGDQFEDELARVVRSWDRWLVIHLEANKQISPAVRKEANSLHQRMDKLMGLLESD
jgi:hypothetical protein